ncbi:WhiB family transcriptional regulator [Rhodococcus sp. IEGM1428]|uniref:WhiB family transcriptional regulator n=1 Tax=Rhodococcus sp. IEGM1428 TaxID=3392191 RepID=UPI003D11835C
MCSGRQLQQLRRFEVRTAFPPLQLPRPQCDEWEWQVRGACRAMPVGMFFPPTELRGYSRSILEKDAKRVCAQCPVIERCLQHALESNEPYGIWGGLTRAERLSVSSTRRQSTKLEESVSVG